jgi:hypothetical protein
MIQPTKIHFEEKILYKTHQHWIVPVLNTIKFLLLGVLPTTIVVYFISQYSSLITGVYGLVVSLVIVFYDHYLWEHSWLLIGNQKVTLSVRNGIFSQFAMNIRYRNIRDSAVSKHSMLGFLLKYGTVFVRSSAAEGDFHAHYVPKVGKVYALINALSRYSDEERSRIDSIEKLHTYHQWKEFHAESSFLEKNMTILRTLPWIIDAIELGKDVREYIWDHEEMKNHGIHEVLRRENVICVLHNASFRPAASSLVRKNASDEVFFPGIPFPEVEGKNVISGSPSNSIHTYLTPFFPYIDENDATILIGWDTK